MRRILRIACCALMPPLLGTYALMIPGLIGDYEDGKGSLEAVLLIPLFASYVGYAAMGIQSLLCALLIDRWLLRWNPRRSTRSYWAFVGYSAVLGGLAGESAVVLGNHEWLVAGKLALVGLGIGALMGILISWWFVRPSSALPAINAP